MAGKTEKVVEEQWQAESSGKGKAGPNWGLLGFPVEKKPAGYQVGKSWRKIPGRVAIVRTDTDTVLQVVGEDYNLLPHRDAFEPIQQALTKMKVPIKQVTTSIGLHGGFARVEWTLAITEKVAKDDQIDLRIVGRNSMNYKSDYSISLGALRLICSNGLRVFEAKAKIGGKHFANLSIEEIMQELHAVLKSDTFPALKRWQKWSTTKVSRASVKKFLEEDARSSLIGKKAAEEIVSYLKDRPSTLWEAYNGVTWYATHRVPASARREPQRIAVAQDKVQKEALRLVAALKN